MTIPPCLHGMCWDPFYGAVLQIEQRGEWSQMQPGHLPPYNYMMSSTTLYIGSHFSSVYIRTSPGYGDVKESSIWLLAVSGQAALSMSKAKVTSCDLEHYVTYVRH